MGGRSLLNLVKKKCRNRPFFIFLSTITYLSVFATTITMIRSLMYISALVSRAIFHSASLAQTALGEDDLFWGEPVSMGSDLFFDEDSSSTLAFFNDVVNPAVVDPDPDPDPGLMIVSGEWCSVGEEKSNLFFKKMRRRRREDNSFCVNNEQNVGDEVQIPDIFNLITQVSKGFCCGLKPRRKIIMPNVSSGLLTL